ncbi:MAG: metallophosphoesterase [Bacteriovoracaceae bacterium]|nr:metallophosphoesterase [Bacteriovoracaceae bacterium]
MNKPFSLIHLSDLHFGSKHATIIKQLGNFFIQRKEEIKLAILTGDLNQRVSRKELVLVKNFITSLNFPLFLVPGNHDIPFYNLFYRFYSPYNKFLKYLGPFTQNYYEDDFFAVYGLWTADHFSVQRGTLTHSNLDEMEEKFKRAPSDKIRIIACHHPLLCLKNPRIKNDIKRIMNIAPHLILWGHEHRTTIQGLNDEQTFPILLASEGKANSFNYVTFTERELLVETYRYSKLINSFEVIDRKIYPSINEREEWGGLNPPPNN